MLISNQSIHPQICHRDLNAVGARLDDVGHVDTKRRFPKRWQHFSVDRDLSDILDVAQIKPLLRSRFEPARRSVDGLVIDRMAGEVLNSSIRVIAPGLQPVEVSL